MKKYKFILCALFYFSILNAKTIYLVPMPGHSVERIFYGQYAYDTPNPCCRDEVDKPFFLLRTSLEKHGHLVKFTENGTNLEDADYVISFSNLNATLLKNLSFLPKEKCFLVVFEPPVTAPNMHSNDLEEIFGKIFTMFDDKIDSSKYFKLHYPQPRLKMIDDRPSFEAKKLCTLIAGDNSSGHPNSLYQRRNDIIAYFKKTDRKVFDLYGHKGAWSNQPSYRGCVDHKWPVLKNYRFSFCYENMGKQNGYITEKIFDSMVAGCVPIYLGAENITQYIPSNCFIDRRKFRSNRKLVHFLKRMNKETYDQYMIAIENFFNSPQAQKFSTSNFFETLVNQID